MAEQTFKVKVMLENVFTGDRTPMSGGGGTKDFNELTNRPSYNSTAMTGDTNIPAVPTRVSELQNDKGYQTLAQVAEVVAAEATAREGAVEAEATARASAIEAEASARESADTSEATNRQTADENLQSQIDALESSVGTLESGKQDKLIAGDNIAIVGNIISAASGGLKELTSDDFNWPVNNPTSVALWLLKPGFYYKDPTSTNFYIRPNTGGAYYLDNTSSAARFLFVVMPGNNASATEEQKTAVIHVFGHGIDQASGHRLAHTIYLTNAYNGRMVDISYVFLDKDIVDNLTTTTTTQALSAKQGKALNDKISALEARVTALGG